jgi:hypothetical protein
VIRRSFLMTSLAAWGQATAEKSKPAPPNYDPTKASPAQLPDPLKGITTPAQWPARRKEILENYAAQVYGRTPNISLDLQWELLGKGVIPDLGTWQEIRLFPQGKGGPSFDVLLALPKQTKKPSCFVGLNYRGNHAVLADPAVKIGDFWMDGPAEMVANHRSTEASRGREASRWPLSMILRSGAAVATACYNQIFPDHVDGRKDSIAAKLRYPDAEADWGAIGVWSWAMHRMVDLLLQIKQLDAQKLYVVGHSRLGKTSLWAGATDERFSAVIVNDSGEGGAALSHRDYGEAIVNLTRSFPHWFGRNYQKFAAAPRTLPFDQHFLLAAVAPRKLYVASALEDHWADPLGEQVAAQEARKVYRFLGLSGQRVGAHVRSGKHDITAEDWRGYLDFLGFVL